MIIIVNKKRWKQILDECQRTRNAANSQKSSVDILQRKVRRLEMLLNEVSKENRAMKIEIKKMKKNKSI